MKENKPEENNIDIEIVMGDDSALKISNARDCVKTLKPKLNETQKKKVIIPKNKK